MNVADVLTELNDHGFEDTDTGRKLAHINAAYFDALARHAWPWLLSIGGFVANTSGDVSMDATAGRPLEVSASVTGERLRQISPQEYFRRFAIFANTAGRPRYWFLYGNITLPAGITFRVYPKPTGSIVLNVLSLLQPPVLTSSTVESAIYIPSTHHRLLVTGALQRLYSMEDDPELAQTFKGEFEERIAHMEQQFLLAPADMPRPEEGVASDDSGDNRAAG